MKKLTAKEEEIMNIFWQHGPMFIREMLAFYKEPKPHYNTVATLVKLYDNSYTRVVSQFIEEEKMGLDELKALIAKIEKG